MRNLAIRLERCPRVLNQQSTNTTVLLNLDDGQYFALEGIGGRIWELCDGSRSLADIVKAIQDEYDAPPDVIRDDALELVNDLIHEKLLRDES